MSAAAAAASDCQALPAWGSYVGVLMGVAGSVGINVGQNMQAAAIRLLPEEKKMSPWSSRGWIVGFLMFVCFSLVNFAAFALAPASVLTPIESIQFVTNVAYSRIVNKCRISCRMLLGVALALGGTVLAVIFGASTSGSCHTLDELEAFWARPAWLVYLVVTVIVAAAAQLTHVVYTRRLKAYTAYMAAHQGSSGGSRVINSTRVAEMKAVEATPATPPPSPPPSVQSESKHQAAGDGAASFISITASNLEASPSPPNRSPPWPPPHHHVVLPLSFTISSASIFGANVIVHSKALSELLAIALQVPNGDWGRTDACCVHASLRLASPRLASLRLATRVPLRYHSVTPAR